MIENGKFLWTALKMLKTSAAYWNEYTKSFFFTVVVFLKKCAQIKKTLIRNGISMKNNGWVRFSVLECSQPKCIQPKIIWHKLRSGVYWHGILEHKDIKWELCVHDIWTNDNLVEWAVISLAWSYQAYQNLIRMSFFTFKNVWNWSWYWVTYWVLR